MKILHVRSAMMPPALLVMEEGPEVPDDPTPGCKQDALALHDFLRSQLPAGTYEQLLYEILAATTGDCYLAGKNEVADTLQAATKAWRAFLKLGRTKKGVA